MRAFLRWSAVLAAALSVLSAVSPAASIVGEVREANSKSALLGATITLREAGRSAQSSRGGGYVIPNVAPGTYTVVASHLGFEDVTQTVTVPAGDGEVRADINFGADVVQMGRFVVSGEREGQARALQQKRAAANIMDAVAADAVGKFPDGNAAEALRRVPGVSLEIDQSEGRFVVIRGIDAQLNNVTLNGQMVGSPAEQGRRGLSMDSVPADLIARLEVTKAVTPDMDHNAIGGSVNIVTQSVFDRPDGYLFGSLSAGYGTFNEKWGWRGASANFGRMLDADRKWGLTAAASYSFRNYASQTSDAGDWSLVNGNWVPASQESFDYDIDRQRLGVNIALEHRPREGHKLYARVNYNEFTDEEGRQLTGFEFGRGNLTNQTATSGSFSQGRATKEYRDYKQNHLIDAYSIGGEHQLDSDSLLTWQATKSRGERETPRRVDWEFRSGGSAFPNSYQLGGPIPIVTPNAAFYDPSAYPFRRVRYRTDDESEDIYTLQADLKRDFQWGDRTGYWKAGAKFYKSEKHQDRTNTNYILASGSANSFTLGATGLAGPEPTGYMEGRYRLGPTINLGALQQYFQDNPQRFTLDAGSTLSNSREADYDAGEEVTSGYAMASLDLNARTTVIAGLRVERTEAFYAALENRNGTFSPLSIPHSYTQVLPGLHFVWRPNDRLVVRAAVTNTYGRAAYTALAPRNVLEDIDLGGGEFQGSLESGNPNLEPFESTNFDASIEYYLKNAGIFSVGVFHKSIDNPVYTNSYTLNDTTYNGRNYSILGISRPENADKGEVTGVEFNWQQFFNFLPAPFDGLGVNVNYTIVDSTAEIFGRTDELPFFKQSDTLGNIALVYEKNRFEARIAYSFNGDYLESVGSSQDDDGYTDRRRVLDAKFSFRINRNLRIFTDFTNLTEEPLRVFSGDPSRSGGYEIYGWNANVGINWSL